MGLSSPKHYQVPTDRLVRKLGFSYLESISIRSKIEVKSNSQQTFPKLLNKSETSNILIAGIDKKQQSCQVDNRKL